MGLTYQAVQWNRQKRIYDAVLVFGVGVFLAGFIGMTKVLYPSVTDEILLMRATAAAAFLLLHVILCVGPLCRLNRRFLPLLYNRRHAGVTMAFLALTHAALAVVTYHAGSNLNPFVSIFVSEKFNGSLASLPFQPFGFVALLIIFLMAATSHDFWLANLTAPVWKALHMLVYVAYALLIVHVVFGVLQAETHPLFAALTGLGLLTVLVLHVASALKERSLDKPISAELGSVSSPSPQPSPWGRGSHRSPLAANSLLSRASATLSFTPSGGEEALIFGVKGKELHELSTTSRIDGDFIEACAVTDIPEKRARIVCLSGERVAIFKYDGKVSAVSNVCQHQNGPLGEGKILDGCITCPWHGYQYLPETGASPPPFIEKVPTFNVRVRDGRVFVHPKPNPPGVRAEPAPIEGSSRRESAHPDSVGKSGLTSAATAR